MSVITLCGSTKFKQEFEETNKRLTLLGHIVISVGLFGHSDCPEIFDESGVKEQLDDIHKRKIDMSDYIYVLNKDQYVGQSTLSEIQYALTTGKAVHFLEPVEATLDYLITSNRNCMWSTDFMVCKLDTNDKLLITKYETTVLQHIVQKVYDLANVNKKYDGKPTSSDLFLHVIDELSECNNAIQSNHRSNESIVTELYHQFDFVKFKEQIKDSFEDEMADQALLNFSISEYLNSNLAVHMSLKHNFNVLRKDNSVANNYNHI